MLTSFCTRSIIIGDFKCEGGAKVANETGKRYMCEKCGSEFIVTKADRKSVV
jgi:Zn finger protein HypA/HybF involved in hydrogenase expression